MLEQNTVTLSPGLFQEFSHLKVLGRYQNEQDLLKASFDALERELNQPQVMSSGHLENPYMSHAGLSPDDYDT